MQWCLYGVSYICMPSAPPSTNYTVIQAQLLGIFFHFTVYNLRKGIKSHHFQERKIQSCKLQRAEFQYGRISSTIPQNL